MTALNIDTLAVMASIFVTGVTSALWLLGQFRKLEKIIYRETMRQNLRIQRIELKVFGETHSGHMYGG